MQHRVAPSDTRCGEGAPRVGVQPDRRGKQLSPQGEEEAVAQQCSERLYVFFVVQLGLQKIFLLSNTRIKKKNYFFSNVALCS